MYARIARFEGGERNWDEFAANVGETVRSGGQGTPFEKVADATTRVMLFVDRENNRGAKPVPLRNGGRPAAHRRRAERDDTRGRTGRPNLGGDVRGDARRGSQRLRPRRLSVRRIAGAPEALVSQSRRSTAPHAVVERARTRAADQDGERDGRAPRPDRRPQRGARSARGRCRRVAPERLRFCRNGDSKTDAKPRANTIVSGSTRASVTTKAGTPWLTRPATIFS